MVQAEARAHTVKYHPQCISTVFRRSPHVGSGPRAAVCALHGKVDGGPAPLRVKPDQMARAGCVHLSQLVAAKGGGPVGYGSIT